MRILAFDTSSAISAVALADGASVIAEDNRGTELRHGDVLLPRIEALLSGAGWALAGLDLVVVGVGPGSFTGLRIGLATAKGLALAAGVALRGVCSLEVLARGIEQDGAVICLTDAGKGDAFGAVYERSGENLHTLLPPRLGRAEEAARAVAALSLHSAVLCGSGARQHLAALLDVLGPSVQVGEPTRDLPRGREVAHAGRLAWLLQGPSDPSALAPSYLRGSDAKLPAEKLALG